MIITKFLLGEIILFRYCRKVSVERERLHRMRVQNIKKVDFILIIKRNCFPIYKSIKIIHQALALLYDNIPSECINNVCFFEIPLCENEPICTFSYHITWSVWETNRRISEDLEDNFFRSWIPEKIVFRVCVNRE